MAIISHPPLPQALATTNVLCVCMDLRILDIAYKTESYNM